MGVVALRLLSDLAPTLRDGTVMAAEAWLGPDDAPRPALLLRTPYPRELEVLPPLLDVRAIVEAGFCLVVQDVRGTGASGGRFEPFVAEGDDGADTVAWVAEQPWCDGRVAMVGASYCGALQWHAAARRPPALAAIAPILAADRAGEGWSFTGGHREHGFLSTWVAATLLAPEDRRADDLHDAPLDVDALAGAAPWCAPWFVEDASSRYWDERSPRTEDVEAPAFIVGGWYDVFVAGTLRAHARARHPWTRLVIGPWGHDGSYSQLVGEADLGAAGDGVVLRERMLAFLAAVLEGREPPGPPVSAYVLGRRAWLDLPAWPPADAAPRSLALAGHGEIAVDPTDLPSPDGGRGLLVGVPGGGWGVRDQRPTAARPDTIVLAAAVPSDAPVLATGPVTARLPVSADGGPERDWVAVLCVLTDDGRMHNLCEGIVRRPVDATEVEIAMGDVCVELPPGAELRLIVAGGWFPRWAPIDEPGTQQVRRGAVLEIAVSKGAG
jgi:predicted acyl esterase